MEGQNHTDFTPTQAGVPQGGARGTHTLDCLLQGRRFVYHWWPSRTLIFFLLLTRPREEEGHPTFSGSAPRQTYLPSPPVPTER